MDDSFKALGDDDYHIVGNMSSLYYYTYEQDNMIEDVSDIDISLLHKPSGMLFDWMMFIGCVLFLHGVFNQNLMVLLFFQEVGCILSSVFGYNNKQINDIDIDTLSEEKKEENIDVKYEDKYYDVYKEMEDVELTDDKMKSLKNSHIYEVTPLGSVFMHYDKENEKFIYYSNSTVPYRYLEVVSRKYVIHNKCKGIYIDMKEQLENSRIKLQEKTQKRKEEEEQHNMNIEDNCARDLKSEKKKNVFAKFKSYNKDGGSRSMSDTANASKSTNNNTNRSTKENKEALLKEKANVYSYEGKMYNFEFLKKVDRKLVDKNYTLTFADFKRMKSETKKTI